MYTLYYLNRKLFLDTIKVETLDVPVLIPEDLIFCNLRKGINFIKEPHKCIDFTDIERLIISSEFTDTSMLKDGDFRKANTYLKALCQVDVPLVLQQVLDDRALWNYPSPVLVLLSETENGEYTPLNRSEIESMYTNMASIPVNMGYWVMLKDVEKGTFSNKMQHYLPV